MPKDYIIFTFFFLCYLFNYLALNLCDPYIGSLVRIRVKCKISNVTSLFYFEVSCLSNAWAQEFDGVYISLAVSVFQGERLRVPMYKILASNRQEKTSEVKYDNNSLLIITISSLTVDCSPIYKNWSIGLC